MAKTFENYGSHRTGIEAILNDVERYYCDHSTISKKHRPFLIDQCLASNAFTVGTLATFWRRHGAERPESNRGGAVSGQRQG